MQFIPSGAEGAVRDEEGPDAAPDHDEVLDAPEAVLPAGPRVPRGPHLRLTFYSTLVRFFDLSQVKLD